MQFLLDNAFQTPTFLVRPEILRRIEPTGVVDRVRTAQNSVMNCLLQTARLDRMVEQVALDGAVAYPPVEFLTELRSGVWAELAKPAPHRHLPPQPAAVVPRHHRQPAQRRRPRRATRCASLLKGELRALDGSCRRRCRRRPTRRRAGTCRTRAIRSRRSSTRARCDAASRRGRGAGGARRRRKTLTAARVKGARSPE